MNGLDIVTIVVFIILIALIIANIVLYLRNRNKSTQLIQIQSIQTECPACPDKKTSGINESCSNNPCVNGLVCVNNVCKIPISGICSSDVECSGESKCINNVCSIELIKESKIKESISNNNNNNIKNDMIIDINNEPKKSETAFCSNSSMCKNYCGNPVLESYNTKSQNTTILNQLPEYFVPFRVVSSRTYVMAIGALGDSELPVLKNNSNSTIFVNNKIRNAVYIWTGSKWVELTFGAFNFKRPVIPIDIASDNEKFYMVCNQRTSDIDAITTTLDSQYRNKRIADEYTYGKTDDYQYRSYVFSVTVSTSEAKIELMDGNRVLQDLLAKPQTECKDGRCELTKEWKDFMNAKSKNSNKNDNDNMSNKSNMMSNSNNGNNLMNIMNMMGMNNNNNIMGKDIINDYIEKERSSNDEKYVRFGDMEWIKSFDSKNAYLMFCTNKSHLYMTNVNTFAHVSKVDTNIPNIRMVRFTDKMLYLVSRMEYNTGKHVKKTIMDTVYIHPYNQIWQIKSVFERNSKIFDPFTKVCNSVYELERMVIEASFETTRKKEFMEPTMTTVSRYIIQALKNVNNELISTGNYSVIVNDIATTDITSSILLTIWDEYAQTNNTFSIVVNPTSYEDYYQVEFDGKSLNQYSRQTIKGDDIITVGYQCV
jgi:hypothetical protein